jgi:hypothetical protein
LESAGIFVSVKNLFDKSYLRISAWVYNKKEDFLALKDFLNLRLRLDRGLGCDEAE